MKILVIEDNPIHQAAAKAQLAAHDLTVVGSYDEGKDLLAGKWTDAGRHALLASWGIKRPEDKNDEIALQQYRRAWTKTLYVWPHDFEMVLVDLMLPASSRSQTDDGLAFAGKEMPIGIFLALLAAQHGAKYVGLLTDTNHHHHPASACLDPLGDLLVGDSRVRFSNAGVRQYSKDDLTKQVSLLDEGITQEEIIEAKDWIWLMKGLLEAD